jgi:hypothetical protein
VTEGGGRRSVVGGQRSEVRGQGPGDRDQGSEVRGDEVRFMIYEFRKFGYFVE